MHAVIEFLPIKEHPNGFPVYWRKLIFNGSPSHDTHINALAHTYVRLVEAALIEYQLGGKQHQEFWDRKESFSFQAINRSVSHFENCITTMHRAINCFKRLRNHKTNDPLSVWLRATKPAFTNERVSKRLRDVRDAVHHLDELLLKGQILEGQPIALRPEGFESQHPSEPDQIIKTFDRLSISSYEVPFSDLAGWLMEMSDQAERIAQFDKA